MNVRSWLARLAFSFLIFAFALVWTGQKRWRAGDRGWKTQLSFTGAALCVVLGATGVRFRHERPRS